MSALINKNANFRADTRPAPTFIIYKILYLLMHYNNKTSQIYKNIAKNSKIWYIISHIGGMNMARRRARRLNNEPKINISKIIAVIIFAAVVFMLVIGMKKLLTGNKSEKIENISYHTVYTNNKWGVIDAKGNIVIEPSYEEMIVIPDEKEDVFICMYDVDYQNETYKTKIIDKNRKEIATDYETIDPIQNIDKNNNTWYEKNLLKVKKDNKYGLIDFTGKQILACEYDNIEPLKGIENSIIIEKDGKVGLCDNKSIIISPEYKEIKGIADDYKNGYIVVNQEGKYGIIDFNKTTILDTKYDEIKPICSNGKYVVKQEDKYIIIDKNENKLVDNSFEDVKELNDSYIIIKENGKFGVIDYDNNKKINNVYDDIKNMNSEYFIAEKNGKYGVISKNDETQLNFEYSNISYVSSGDFIVVESENLEQKIFDSKFEEKLIGIISEINTSKGYIKIFANNEYKYYNFKFEEKQAKDILTLNTLFLSKKDGKYGYVDSNGKVVVDYIYEDATEQNIYGYASVELNGLWGCIDKTGKIVVEPKYDLSKNVLIDFIGKWHIGVDMSSNYYTDV